jgi:hypothetical protein
MKPSEHLVKAKRLEASLARLDPEADYEMVVELCMLAASHYFNVALHATDVTHEAMDQSHTFQPPMRYLSRAPGPEIQRGMEALRFVEGLRKRFVRGGAAYDLATIAQCLERFDEAKVAFLSAAGQTVADQAAADPTVAGQRGCA